MYRPVAWIAHGMNGIVLMAFQDPGEIKRIRETHRAVIEKASLEVRREISTFGLTPAEYELMRKLKSELDPEGRLNPGRHVDGERR
jgi:FAD/FMN-containing dehydrogenase